ncbi:MULTISPECIES: hypothetical protein [Streptomyces]|uniref:Uncharacterized protein n=1 Tax=Streptomyces griseosporeus TaxID=1910 RepID=A0ABV3L0J6_STRGS|nr:hypothetical protein [Streptomyces actuosus]
MATYSADYLKRLLTAVERFEEAFGRWMETQEESDHVQSRGLFPTVWPKDGQDQSAIRMLELDVAEPQVPLPGRLPSRGRVCASPGSESLIRSRTGL